ncbi:MAG: F-type H+-transporting ATPase subunit gamma [Actinomycetota bacterium]|nr:F-type H+-transporting ATPase subunit gamma [Actinomycetota bacterium]
MAGGQERVLRRRIKSVQSTKKITKAMELIAASRIVKAQARVAAARPYSEQITAVIGNLASAGAGASNPLLVPRDEVRTVGFVVIAADRGLSGGYNSTVIRAAERQLQADVAAGRDYRLVLVGKKATKYFRFRGYKIEASFEGFSDAPTYENARAVAAAVMRLYADGEIDQVELAYTQFISVASLRVHVRRCLPLEAIGEIASAEASTGPSADYEFEPEPGAILEEIVPRYIESRLFAAMLDAAASQHAAQQRAMKSATDNADELIKILTRGMNRARQDSITTEIIEIASGAEALAAAASGEVDYLHDRIEDPDLFRHWDRNLDRRTHPHEEPHAR